MYYLCVFLTIILTVYGQIIIKWQVLKAGTLPIGSGEKVFFLMHLLINPWVISSFIAALIASLTWMAAMTKLQLSHTYPFVSLSFVLVLILSAIVFNEPITTPKVTGMLLLVFGIIVGSQG